MSIHTYSWMMRTGRVIHTKDLKTMSSNFMYDYKYSDNMTSETCYVDISI